MNGILRAYKSPMSELDTRWKRTDRSPGRTSAVQLDAGRWSRVCRRAHRVRWRAPDGCYGGRGGGAAGRPRCSRIFFMTAWSVMKAMTSMGVEQRGHERASMSRTRRTSWAQGTLRVRGGGSRSACSSVLVRRVAILVARSSMSESVGHDPRSPHGSQDQAAGLPGSSCQGSTRARTLIAILYRPVSMSAPTP